MGQTIYKYNNNNEFDKSRIIGKINEISEQLEDETNKPQEEQDIDLQRRLIYEQFIQGLKLSTGFVRLY